MNVLAVNSPPPPRFRPRSLLSARRNLFALAITGLFAAPVPSARAATINVDGTNCTLAEAIHNAN